MNATFYYNLSGTWTKIGNTSYTDGCYIDIGGIYGHCNVTLDTSGLIDGNYSINATISNGTDTLNATILTYWVIFDNTAPVVEAANITAPTSSSSYAGTILLNATVTDATSKVASVFFNITNSSGGQSAVATAANTAGTNYWNTTYATTGLSDGVYNVTVWATDNSGNINNTALVHTLTVDNTAPGITITKSSSTQTSLTLSVAITDTLSGINTSCGVDREGATVTGTGATQTITESSLACGNSYTYVVTCADNLGNSLTVTSALMQATICSGGLPANTGGTSTPTWTTTYVASNEELETGYRKEMSSKTRVKVRVGGQDHHVGITEITATEATIRIESDPIIVKLSIGGETKADVDDDGIYDVYVKLESISNNKAEVTIRKISEEIPEGGESTSVEGGEIVTEGEEEEGSMPVWIWAIIIVVVVAALGVGINKARQK